MKLYEIDAEILRLTDQITFDEETGEVLCDIEALMSEIEALQTEKKSVLTGIAKYMLNIRSEVAALKAEEVRLSDRRRRLEKTDARLMALLDRECNGEKTDLGVATVCYRKTTKVGEKDTGAALTWLAQNHSECVKRKDPEISVSEVKKLLSAGVEVPGLELITDYSCSLR